MVLMEELYGKRKPLNEDELKFYKKVNDKSYEEHKKIIK